MTGVTGDESREELMAAAAALVRADLFTPARNHTIRSLPPGWTADLTAASRHLDPDDPDTWYVVLRVEVATPSGERRVELFTVVAR